MAAQAALDALLPALNAIAALLPGLAGAPPPPVAIVQDYEPQQFTTAATPVEMTMSIANCQHQIKMLEHSKVKSMDSPEYHTGDKFGLFFMEFSTLLDRRHHGANCTSTYRSTRPNFSPQSSLILVEPEETNGMACTHQSFPEQFFWLHQM